MKIPNAFITFCENTSVAQGTLLGQGIMDYIEQFQTRKGDHIESTCRVQLAYVVKSDFQEYYIRFQQSHVVLYLVRMSDPERNFVSKTTMQLCILQLIFLQFLLIQEDSRFKSPLCDIFRFWDTPISR